MTCHAVDQVNVKMESKDEIGLINMHEYNM